MKEKPILFSGSMVRAILDGRKTQTRRIVKPQHHWSPDMLKPEYVARVSKHGTVGDQLWVKETHAVCKECGTINFAATVNERKETKGRVTGFCCGCDEHLSSWKPSIFMFRNYSRITLEIAEVRVERLQDISEEDAMAEGCCIALQGHDDDFARNCYRELWDKINGSGSWAANPWVWAITFKQITPIRESE